MRKLITWAAILLLLVVSLGSPVVSRTTPYCPEDPSFPGPNPDHPWGGDQNTSRTGFLPSSATTGISALDFTYNVIFKRLVTRMFRHKPATTITTTINNPNPAQTSGGATPSAAN